MIDHENIESSHDSSVSHRTPTPLDLAVSLAAKKLIETPLASPELTPSSEEAEKPYPGQIIERDGQKFVLKPYLYSKPVWKDGQRTYEDVPATYAQYYSHTFYINGGDSGPMEPGPGWDARHLLRDKEYVFKKHNRTFSDDELKDLPFNLPDEPYLDVWPLPEDTH